MFSTRTITKICLFFPFSFSFSFPLTHSFSHSLGDFFSSCYLWLLARDCGGQSIKSSEKSTLENLISYHIDFESFNFVPTACHVLGDDENW